MPVICYSAFAIGKPFCPFQCPTKPCPEKPDYSSSTFEMVWGMLTSLQMFDPWCCTLATEVDIDCCNCCMWFWPVKSGRTTEISCRKADKLQTCWVQGLQRLLPKFCWLASYTPIVRWTRLFQSVNLYIKALFHPATFSKDVYTRKNGVDCDASCSQCDLHLEVCCFFQKARPEADLHQPSNHCIF